MRKPWIVPWGRKRMPQRLQELGRVTFHRSTHSNREQYQTEKFNYVLDWLQKGIWCSCAKLDNKLTQNVQNITWSYKLYWQNHENLERGIDSRRKKLCWNKDPKRDFPRRCTITLTIHNCHEATQTHTQKMHSRIKILVDCKKRSITWCTWVTSNYFQNMKKNRKLWYTQLEYTVRTSELNLA